MLCTPNKKTGIGFNRCGVCGTEWGSQETPTCFGETKLTTGDIPSLFPETDNKHKIQRLKVIREVTETLNLDEVDRVWQEKKDEYYKEKYA